MTSIHSYELEQELFLKTKFTAWGGKLKGCGEKKGTLVVFSKYLIPPKNQKRSVDSF